jgi:4-amino-4-deoxy-L-arabinose transferase-like glycosyltransferase
MNPRPRWPKLAAWFQGQPDGQANLQADASQADGPADRRRLLRRIFWTGFLVRVLYMTVAHTWRIRLAEDHFQFGWEMGRIARALATGRGFSDPFMAPSGPTAWCPPAYPLLIAAAFKLFGVYTGLSAWFILTVNSVFSALTATAIYRIALRTFNRSVALWAAWVWALYPAAMQYAVHWVWDMAITACLFSWILLVALRLRGMGDPAPPPPRVQTQLWAAFGLLWGIVTLFNSSLLTFLPFCGLWILWGYRRTLLPALARATLAAALCAACIVPWIYRNWVALHAFVPMRSNLGCELYASSLQMNNGFPWGATISVIPQSADFKQYHAMGELAFCKQRGQMAQAIFDAHPGRFARDTRRRIYFFWFGVPHPVENTLNSELTEFFRQFNYSVLSVCGLFGLALALWRRKPAAILFAGAFLIVPAIYYLVTVQARFRSPLEPLICILGVYLFQSADRTRTWSHQLRESTPNA